MAATLSRIVTSHELPIRLQKLKLRLGICAPRVMTSRKVVSIAEGSGVTGTPVPATGVYEVSHSAHRLPDVVTLLAGQEFPRCQACEELVTFKLQHRLPSADRSLHFRVNLYQLPVLDRYGRAG